MGSERFVVAGLAGMLCLAASLPARAQTVALETSRWKSPDRHPKGAITELADLDVDGDLAEWSDVDPISLDQKPFLAYQDSLDVTPRTDAVLAWKGMRDGSADIYCAWTEAGLAVAAAVTDDNVVPGRKDDKASKRDSVELFVGTTVVPRMALGAKGAFHFVIYPPSRGREPYISSSAKGLHYERISVGGVKTGTGYTLELLIPWDEIGGFKPVAGAPLALQFVLNDFEGGKPEAVVISRNAAQEAAPAVPEFMVFEVGEGRAAAGRELDLYSYISVPAVCLDDTASVQIEAGARLVGHTETLALTIDDWQGKRVLEKDIPASGFTALSGRVRQSPAVTWDCSRVADGTYVLGIVFKGRDGKPIGEARRSTTVLCGASRNLAAAMTRLDAVRLPSLAQTDPFKANAYLGVASAADWFKVCVQKRTRGAIIAAMEEVDARFAAIENGPIRESDSLPGLLELTRNPEAQVAVEISRTRFAESSRRGAVSIYWGSLPIATAMAAEFADAAVAATSSVKAIKAAANVRPYTIMGTDCVYAFHTFRNPVYSDSDDVTKTWEKPELYAASSSTNAGVMYFSKGRLAFTVPSPSPELAEAFSRLIIAGQPVMTAQADEIRRLLLKTIPVAPQPLKLPEGRQLYCGDVHCHTFYSDGVPSAFGAMSQAAYCGLDFSVIADHGTTAGANAAIAEAEAFKFGYGIVRGVELNSKWGHLNVYPLKDRMGFSPTLEAIIRDAHARHAVIQLNHPETGYTDLPDYIRHGLKGSGFDGWEHMPSQYVAWKAGGNLSLITGGTDSHDGTFTMSERTLILAPVLDGNALADAIRGGNAVMVDPWNGSYNITRGMPVANPGAASYFFGSDRMIQIGVDALAEGACLKQAKIARIRQMLGAVDIKGILRASNAVEPRK